MRKVLTSLILLTFILAPRQEHNSASAESLLSPGEVITAINQYRAQNGLYAYQSNSILMNTAQQHSNYQASIGTITHTGAGGTRPIDRAYAAGYGDGQIIFISEIIYGGTNATINDAMAFWKSSPNHNPWMLSGTYIEIGAGVATDGTWIYYTALMANPAGGEAPPPGPDDGNPGGGGGATVPVLVSTPNADGSVIHIVQPGQTLIGIAQAYEVTLAVIFELNNMDADSWIFPEDEILIKAADIQATVTPTATQPPPTAAHSPTPSPTPTSTPSPASLAGAAGASQSEGQPASVNPAVGEGSSLRWIVILAVAGIFFILMGGLLIPSTKEET